MVKSIIKEATIVVLLCVAIILIIGILLYDYIPTNKIVPTKVAYETPNNVKEEINEKITEIEKTEISYEITDVDLKLYKQTSSYKPGKANPFSLTIGGEEDVSIDEGPGTNNDGTISSENKETNAGSTETFFNDTK